MPAPTIEPSYNPDVLSCIANLSNDEVFTPPEVANAMLDLLPQELFCSPDTTFLDPACKSGVFLREIAKRLLAGLADTIPDLQQRIDHIFRHQLYGIAITELTGLLSRRSVYCSKYANSVYSVCRFGDVQGNIRFRRVQHRWQEGRCVFCGASQKEYGDARRTEDLETHAYELIHTTRPEDIFKMKFDVIVSNPPYQLSDGGNNASAVPIYHRFVENMLLLNPSYLTMIIPARWYSGGRGLDKFRSSMITDPHLKVLYDFVDAGDCFPGVDISGGVCYFLWENLYTGPCTVINVNKDERCKSVRYLNQYPVLIRSNKAIRVLDKIQDHKYKTLSQFVSSQKPFGLRTYARPEDKGELTLRWNGGKGPITREKITAGQAMIDQWKVIVSRVFYEHGGKSDKDGQNRVLSIVEILGPGEVCSETYIVVNSFSSQIEAENLCTYLKTKFVRFLILQASSSIMITRNSFAFVPALDFKQTWTDEILYKNYRLTKSDIHLIESTIKPWTKD